MAAFVQLRTHPVMRHRLFRGLVDVVTGAAVFSDVDLVHPLLSPFEWRRVYNSIHHSSSPIVGPGFRHCCSQELYLNDEAVRYVDQLGLATTFPALDVGARCAINGLVLERSEETRYRVHRSNNVVSDFRVLDPAKSPRLTGLISGAAFLTLQYDEPGLLVNASSSEGGVIDLSYLDGLLVKLELSNKEDPALRHSASYHYSTEGMLTSVETTQDHAFRYDYEEERVTRRISSLQGLIEAEYNKEGRCIRAKLGSDERSIRLRYAPDKRMTWATASDGGEWVFHYTEREVLDYVIDPYGCLTTFVLDDVGRLVQQIDPAGETVAYTFDWTGVPVERRDRYERKTALRGELELPGWLARTSMANALEIDGGDLFAKPDRLPSRRAIFSLIPKVIRREIRRAAARSSQSPDAVGEVDEMTDVKTLASGCTRRWERDAYGQVMRFTDADGGRCSYEYGSNGSLRRIEDPKGVITSCEHNELGQLEWLLSPRGVRNDFTYDLVGRLSEVHRHGRCRDQYAYNLVGDLVEKRDGSGEMLVASTYGPGGLLLTRTLTSGDWQQLTYDRRGRLEHAVCMAGELHLGWKADGQVELDARDGLGVAFRSGVEGAEETVLFDRFVKASWVDERGHRIVRDPTGAEHRFQELGNGLVLKELANGLNELSQYDSSGQCLLRSTCGNPWKNRVWSRRYAYSGEGDLASDDDSERGANHYIYDLDRRLIEARRPDGSTERYSYDRDGNLLSSPGHAFVFDQRSLLVRADDAQVEHNARDHIRLVDSGEKVYWFYYDSLDQLTEVRLSDGRSYMAEFDVFGRRTRKSFDGQGRCFYWNGGRLEAEISTSGAVRIYVYVGRASSAPFMWIDYEALDAPPERGTRYYTLTNHLGCPLNVIDDEGVTVWSATISPFGEAIVSESGGLHQPLRYPGWYHDDDLGLVHNRFRTYSPAWGRYLESNPIGLAGGTNLHTFIGPPVSRIARRGLRQGNRVVQEIFRLGEMRPTQELSRLIVPGLTSRP